ncbi:hypothetical protein CesoFtcFv8_000453 [Champsocephalus esox]|nr:hypothetical protein CesoFtcFv8_000453 [Champsocephalus esox]
MLSQDPKGLVVPSGSCERCSQIALKASWCLQGLMLDRLQKLPLHRQAVGVRALTLIIPQNQNLSSGPDNEGPAQGLQQINLRGGSETYFCYETRFIRYSKLFRELERIEEDEGQLREVGVILETTLIRTRRTSVSVCPAPPCL